jgi:hypothetical protein
VRDGSPFHVLVCSLALIGCRSEASTVSEQSEAKSSRAEPAEPEPVEPTTSKPSAEPERSADHEQRVADLEALCRALDHDYVDGTLSDYYAKVEPKTEWGRERVREGEESITPGRLLQNAATGLGVDLDGPELASCRKLFDELEDLE